HHRRHFLRQRLALQRVFVQRNLLLKTKRIPSSKERNGKPNGGEKKDSSEAQLEQVPQTPTDTPPPHTNSTQPTSTITSAMSPSTAREKLTPPPSPLQRMKNPFTRRLSPGRLSFRARMKMRVIMLILCGTLAIAVLNELRCAKYGCVSRVGFHGSEERGGGSVLPPGWKEVKASKEGGETDVFRQSGDEQETVEEEFGDGFDEGVVEEPHGNLDLEPDFPRWKDTKKDKEEDATMETSSEEDEQEMVEEDFGVGDLIGGFTEAEGFAGSEGVVEEPHGNLDLDLDLGMDEGGKWIGGKKDMDMDMDVDNDLETKMQTQKKESELGGWLGTGNANPSPASPTPKASKSKKVKIVVASPSPVAGVGATGGKKKLKKISHAASSPPPLGNNHAPAPAPPPDPAKPNSHNFSKHNPISHHSLPSDSDVRQTSHFHSPSSSSMSASSADLNYHYLKDEEAYVNDAAKLQGVYDGSESAPSSAPVRAAKASKVVVAASSSSLPSAKEIVVHGSGRHHSTMKTRERREE
ncbi:hypothetical protein CC80DRAFT_564694, partial [Byssothecium circinans]